MTTFKSFSAAETSEVTFFQPRFEDIDLLALRYQFGNLYRRAAVSLIRITLREEECDQMPKILGIFRTYETDEYGNDFVAEVEYNSRGYRATFGGHIDKTTKSFKWQCYMD